MKLILQDLRYKQSIYAQDGARVSLLKIFLSDGTSANVLYRAMRYCARRKILLPLALFFQYINKLLNQCVIGLNADFGGGFTLMHPVGVIINSKVSGGNNVVVESGVVIGDEKGQSPILGNDIFIGAGAKIIGGLDVGDRAKVGANAVVVKSVAADTTVVGIPARPIRSRKGEGEGQNA